MTEFPWSAVETNPQCEDIAEQSIRALGYDPWLPKFKKLLRGQRIENGRRIRSRKDTTEMRPLFRGYLFVAIPYDDAGYSIDTAHGVKRLIRHPHTEEGWGKPKRIRARVIIRLQEAVEAGIWENQEGNLCYGQPKLHVAEGDTVRTPTGIVGVVLALDERGRVELLVDLMGRTSVSRNVEASTLELLSA